MLTIGASQWRYSGSIREEHSYTRRGGTLIVRRLVDSAVIRAQYAKWEDMGKLTPYADTLLITTLTPRRLVTKDSTQEPDGSIYRVWHGYYSR